VQTTRAFQFIPVPSLNEESDSRWRKFTLCPFCCQFLHRSLSSLSLCSWEMFEPGNRCRCYFDSEFVWFNALYSLLSAIVISNYSSLGLVDWVNSLSIYWNSCAKASIILFLSLYTTLPTIIHYSLRSFSEIFTSVFQVFTNSDSNYCQILSIIIVKLLTPRW
jgi:cellulose synthase/poly-beta-1,6-N-acetylglucosamine synthase-like glycosyltransferase